MDVARWVRPAIEHAQHVLSGGLGQEWECGFFEGSCFVLTLYGGFFLGFLMLLMVASFFQKSNCFWFGFVFRLFCALLFLSLTL